MTDKQIIIDGVDVSGCTHYKTGDCLISPVWCDQFYNCDYKQLKRKEQDLETICKTFDIEYIHDKETNQIIAKYNKLLAREQECEEYKVQAKKYLADYYEENKKCEELKAEIKHYKQIAQYHGNLSVKYTNKSAKLKQTLIEIKEIVEKQCNICKALTPIDEYKDCKKCWQGVILQKISEVLNDR